MAYPYKNTFEGGTNGAAVSTANSGGASGDAFTHVMVGSGGSIQFTSSLPWGGTGAKITFGSGATYLRWDDTSVGVGDTRRIARRPVWLTGEPTSNFELAHVYLDGGTRMGALAIYGTNDGTHKGKLAIYDGTGAILTASRSTAPLSTGTLYWVEFAVKSGSGATGELSWRLLAADGVTEIESYTNTAATTNADNPARVRFGHNGAAGLAADYLDDLRFEAVPSGWLGPLGATPPTLALTDGVRHIIDARASTVPVGSIGYTIGQESGPAVAAAEITAGLWHVTPHETDTLVYEVTATGSLGGSDTAAVEVPPLSAGGGSSPVEQLIWDGDDWV